MQIPFRYVDRNTIVHRLHPLVKILYIFLTLFITLTPLLNVRYVLVPLVWLVMSIMLWALARIEVSRFQALIKLLISTFHLPDPGARLHLPLGRNRGGGVLRSALWRNECRLAQSWKG